MHPLRIIKYPGSKGALLPHISNAFKESGCSVFVDVFGGSGIVSLNMDAKKIIYNDLNRELVNIFKSIKADRQLEIYGKLKALLSVGQIQQKDRYGSLVTETYSARQYNRTLRKRIESMTANSAVKSRSGEGELAKAFISICKFSVSFGGLGNGYATGNEKSPHAYLERTMNTYSEIRRRVSTWEIECEDFRKIIEKYDSPETFFFLDPPYLSGKWYSDDFVPGDFLELVEMLGNISGTFLLALESKVSGYDKFNLHKYYKVGITTSTSKRSEPSRTFDLFTNLYKKSDSQNHQG